MNRFQCSLLLACLLIAVSPGTESATITVDTTVDNTVNDSNCTLREAVLAAGQNGDFLGCAGVGTYGDDVVEFDASLFVGAFGGINLDTSLVVLGGSVELRAPSGKSMILQNGGAGPVVELSQVIAGPDRPGFTLTRVWLAGGFSSDYGGAIRVSAGTGHLVLNDSNLQNNEAMLDGGAIGLATDDPIRITINSSVLQGNDAGENGGAIGGVIPLVVDFDLGYSAILEIFDSTIVNNTAGIDGGAVHFATPSTSGPSLVPAFVEIEGSTFRANSAGENGGAVFATTTSGGLAIIDFQSHGTIYLDNEAQIGGGAIYLQQAAGGSANNLQATISNNRFEGNSTLDFANGGGGALAAVGSFDDLNGPVRLLRNSFHSNSTGGSGGAVFFGRIVGNMVNNLVANNTAGLGGGGLFIGNTLDATFDREYRIIANTFYRNIGGTQTTQSAGWNWHYFNEDVNANGIARFYGNTTTAADGGIPSGDEDCFRADLAAWDSAFNVGNDFTCVEGPSDFLSFPNTPLEPISHPVHTMTAIPQPGSRAIDFWPEPNCNDDEFIALQVDLIGPRRVADVPIEGDGEGPANCDAGAFEAPEFVEPALFVDSFESGSHALIGWYHNVARQSLAAVDLKRCECA